MTSGADVSDEKLTLIRSLPVMIETVVVVFILFLFSEALVAPLLADETDPESSRLLRMMWLPIYGVIGLLACLRLPGMLAISLRMPMTLLVLMLIGISTLWSIDGDVTFRRFIALALTTAFGVWLAARYTWRDLLAILGLTWLLLAVGSLVAALAVPSFGVESNVHAGAWRGLWFTKNIMGGNMARASLLFGVLALTQTHLRKVWIGGFLISIVLVIMSTSKTSLLGMLLGFGILVLGAIMRRGPVSALAITWASVTFGGVLALVFVFQPDFIFEMLGRDPSLTGRTDIWAALTDVIADRPWFGYGYGAFWTEGSLAAEYVREQTQWRVPTAHNGWLELWLGVGAIGVGAFAISFLASTLRAIGTAFNNWYGFFALGFILQFLLFSMSESIIFQQNAITWLTYVAISGALLQQTLKNQSIKPSRPRRGRDFLIAK